MKNDNKKHRKDKTMDKHIARPGDTIVIHGKSTLDRELVTFTDADSLVAYFRERDDPDGEIRNNEEYMRTVANRLQELTDSSPLPIHDSEAFVAALFRLGLCSKTTLN